MERKLKNLFEYQRFEQDSRLAKLIQQTESRSRQALSDDDLFFVNAAGVPDQFLGENDPEKNEKKGK